MVSKCKDWFSIFSKIRKFTCIDQAMKMKSAELISLYQSINHIFERPIYKNTGEERKRIENFPYHVPGILTS